GGSNMRGRLGPVHGPVKRAGAGLIRAACGQLRLAPAGRKRLLPKPKACHSLAGTLSERPSIRSSTMPFKVAVVGATGNVGREMLSVLDERQFPASEVHAVASSRSTGSEVSFGERGVLKVKNLEAYDFHGIDIALFSPGAKVSAVHAPRAAEAGAVVIDNTSQFRMDKD